MHKPQRPRMPGFAQLEDFVPTGPSCAHALTHHRPCHRMSSSYDLYSTSFSHTSCHTMQVPVVSKLELTPATRARRVRTQRTAHTPTTHTVVGRSPIIVGSENQPFLVRQPNASYPCNKATASAHVME